MAQPLNFRQNLIQVGQLLYQKGMLAGTDGNLSARLDNDRILVTCRGVAKGRLQEDDFVTVNLEGKVVEGERKPSSETAMHLTVYNNRPEINACVHAHPPYATSFAVAGIKLERNILPEVVVFVGEIPLIEYAPPGTGAISKAIAPHLKDSNAFLLRNHGLLTIGRTTEEAFHRHETVEHFAQILHLARQLGKVQTISADELKRLDEIRLSRTLTTSEKS